MASRWGFLAVIGLTLFVLARFEARAKPATVHAIDLDLTHAIIVHPAQLTNPESHAIALLVEALEKRTLVRWPNGSKWPEKDVPVIAVGAMASLGSIAGPYNLQARTAEKAEPEGYRIWIERQPRAAPTIFVVGNDE